MVTVNKEGDVSLTFARFRELYSHWAHTCGLKRRLDKDDWMPVFLDFGITVNGTPKMIGRHLHTVFYIHGLEEKLHDYNAVDMGLGNQ